MSNSGSDSEAPSTEPAFPKVADLNGGVRVAEGSVPVPLHPPCGPRSKGPYKVPGYTLAHISTCRAPACAATAAAISSASPRHQPVNCGSECRLGEDQSNQKKSKDCAGAMPHSRGEASTWPEPTSKPAKYTGKGAHCERGRVWVPYRGCGVGWALPYRNGGHNLRLQGNGD